MATDEWRLKVKVGDVFGRGYFFIASGLFIASGEALGVEEQAYRLAVRVRPTIK